MMKKITSIVLCFFALSVFGQEAIINSWKLNTTNKTSSYWEPNTGPGGGYTFTESNTLADVLSVCYNKDTVWITSEGMTNDMGQYTNPGAPSGQGYTMGFPRNPMAGSGSEEVPEVFMVGILTNGIPIFGLGDGKSYSAKDKENSNNGDGKWVGEAYYTEGETLDTAFAAHPQQAGAYHSHATPFRLYDDPSMGHSPIVGYANDGYPVYGPFGYSSPNDANSTVSRMVSSYQLRTITKRTILPDGSNSMPPGPDVTTNGNYDIGSYIQDYEFIDDLGTLDEHNGRLCVTPEYPQGTYAYFVTVDASGIPQFPYYIGTTYYGTPKADNNFGGAEAGNGLECRSLITNALNNDASSQEVLDVYPNPTSSNINFLLPEAANGKFDVRVIDVSGRLVYSDNMLDANNRISIQSETLSSGVYSVRVIGYNQLYTFKFTKQ